MIASASPRCAGVNRDNAPGRGPSNGGSSGAVVGELGLDMRRAAVHSRARLALRLKPSKKLLCGSAELYV